MRAAYALQGAAFLLLMVMGVILYARSSQVPLDAQSSSLSSLSSNHMAQPMTLTSAAFENGNDIPSVHTCDGKDISPELRIGRVPEGAESLVLVMDDPDSPSGTWDHWVVFNIPPSTVRINAGSEPAGTPGLNTWKKTGYGGPCPGKGKHRYVFTLYAVDRMLTLKEGSAKAEVETAIQGHVLAKAVLMGTYERVGQQ